MGYDVHITRAEDWTESKARPITLDEWLSYIRSDRELRLDDTAELTTDEGHFRGETLGSAIWTAWSQHGVDNQMGSMNYADGRIVVKYPDAEFLRKMHVIATYFGANVQGDDGERYDAQGNRIPEQPAPPTPRPRLSQRLTSAVKRLFKKPPKLVHSTFKSGDRVKDVFGSPATVIEIDPKANAGLGRIRIRHDDGREATFALAACGLTSLNARAAR